MRGHSLSLSLSLGLASSLPAQVAMELGSWDPGFFHKTIHNPAIVPTEVAPYPTGFALSNWVTINNASVPPGTPGGPGQPGFNALHACLIPDGPHRGEVLVWDGNLDLLPVRQFQPYAIVNPYWPNPNPFSAGGSSPNVGYRFYNGLIDLRVPNGSGGFTSRGELFCGGKTWLPDGKLLTAGGTSTYHDPVNNFFEGTSDLYHFDPTNFSDPQHPFGRWSLLGQLASKRWYPTVILDGARFPTPQGYRVLVVGGLSDADKLNSYESILVRLSPLAPAVQIETRAAGNNFGPASNRCFGGPTLLSPVPFITGFTSYPRVHVLTTGELFLTGELRQSTAWTHPPTSLASYDVTRGQITTLPLEFEEGTSLIFPNFNGVNNRIFRIGGSSSGVPSDWVETCFATTPGNWIVPPVSPPFKHTRMNHPRAKPNVTILPDGRLFAVGGIGPNGTPNLVPEMLSNTWVDMTPASSPRQYHSCSLLLPDGRVFTCGGEGRTLDYEIYNPPYLTKGLERPLFGAIFDSNHNLVFQQSSTPLSYDTTDNEAVWMNDLSVGISVDKVVLMRPAALTHHDDGGQRYFELPSRAGSNPDRRLFDTPRTNTSGFPQVPPGWWMMFLITNEGAPSNAYWVLLQ